jgi:prepilin-type N-terminal cleavage/methylation domain-containing protein
MRRRSRGLSLAELLVVITLIGLVALVAVPKFAAVRDGAAVESALAETIRTFATARELAVLRRSAVAVVIDPIRGSLEVRSRGQVVMRSGLGTTYGVALATNRDSLVYDPRGLGFGASNLSLILRRGRVADTVVVSRLGRARW